MMKLMTKRFFRWAKNQKLTMKNLFEVSTEIENEQFEADLGGGVIKKRIRFPGRGKSGSGRIVVCYKKMIVFFLFTVSQKMKKRI